MAEIFKPQTIEVYRAWVKCIRDQQPLLTDWERDFITSVEQRLMFGHNLTEHQANTLENIYASKTK